VTNLDALLEQLGECTTGLTAAKRRSRRSGHENFAMLFRAAMGTTAINRLNAHGTPGGNELDTKLQINKI
jgi:hypothetical protein